MMNERKFKLDWKVFVYTLLWTGIVGAGKNLIFSEIRTFPDLITYGLAGVIITIGLIVAIAERRMGMEFFYAWGKNWNGGGIGNSSLICGAGVGFMPLTVVLLLIVSVGRAGVITFIKNVVPVNEKNVNTVETYPFA